MKWRIISSYFLISCLLLEDLSMSAGESGEKAASGSSGGILIASSSYNDAGSGGYGSSETSRSGQITSNSSNTTSSGEYNARGTSSSGRITSSSSNATSSGGYGSGGTSSSGLTTSASSNATSSGGYGTSKAAGGISVTTLGASCAVSSGVGSSATSGGSGAATKGAAGAVGFRATGKGSSGMSSGFVSGGRDGKRDGGLGAVTVSTVTKNSYSSGGSGEAKRGSSSAVTYSPVPKEKKGTTTMAAAVSDVFYESSSTNSSPEYKRKEYGTSSLASSSATRGRTQSRESEIRARLQSASPPASWTELDDVKRLLRGNHSTSTSPTRSPNNTLPIPKKASVETRTMSDSAATEHYGSIWSGGGSSGYGYNTNPNNLSATSTLYSSGVQNNLTLSSPSMNGGFSAGSTVPMYGLQNNLGTTSPMAFSATGANTHTVYGVQKNVSGPVIGTTTVRPSSPINDESPGKDFKFVLIEKENAPVKKETERLVMTKDTGKQFMSTAHATTSAFFSGDSLQRDKQKLSSSTMGEGTDTKCRQDLLSS
ncbi:hypothetical protein CesoFtcFv8_009418 [Champsocephalus esox]|uniref:Uncharacterized protein n=1 Tax=Champsocephalus esox TaxID=159716 RepID=A0AAN8CCM5_9TELE|nr:hypothetical protein CesoFtcFv8_009418 [Champsocephalus esox]